MIGTVNFVNTVTEGSVPSSVPAGSTFSVSGYAIKITIPASIANLVKGKQVSGIIATGISATGATPATQSVSTNFTVTIPDTVPSAGVIATATGTVAPYTASSTAGTASFSTTGSDKIVNFTIASSNLGSFDCTNSPAPLSIVSTSVNVSPTVSVATPGPYVIPATGSTLLQVTGSNWPHGITGAVLSWNGGKGADTDTGTFSTSRQGILSGSIPLSSAEDSASSTFPFNLTLMARSATASATMQVTIADAYTSGGPGAPGNVVATAGNSSALVSWTTPVDNGLTITAYTINTYTASHCSPTACSGSPVTTTTIPATDAATSGAPEAVTTGLTNGASFAFTVTATDTKGNSPPSSPSTAVTPHTIVPSITATSVADGRNAMTTYNAMQRYLYYAQDNLYRGGVSGNLFSALWPFNNAFSATDLANSLPASDGSYIPDIASSVTGLLRYQDMQEATPSGRAQPPAFESAVPPPLGIGGYTYYDDNAWAALNLLDSYHQTSNPFYLQLAERTFQFLVSGWSTDTSYPCPGGLFWVDSSIGRGRNTVSNAPTAEVGAELYQVTGNTSYLTWSERIYQWVRTCLSNSIGMYYDHINPDGTIGNDLWSYNQGTMIGAGVFLYEDTGNTAYLDQAVQTARASVAYYGNGNSGSQYLYPQGPAFNAIYFRNLFLLNQFEPNTAYGIEAQNYVNTVSADFLNPATGIFNFSGQFPTIGLVNSNAPMVEIEALLGGAVPFGSTYFPVPPARICDTRSGNPSHLSGTTLSQCDGKPISAGQVLSVRVVGVGGVPLGATTVFLNITTIGDTIRSRLDVYPAGSAPVVPSVIPITSPSPSASSQWISVPPSGAIDIRNSAGTTQVVVDVEGYMAPAVPATPGSIFTPGEGTPICNAMPGNPSHLSGVVLNKCEGKIVHPGVTLALAVPGVPLTATAVLVSVTATSVANHGYVTVYGSLPMPMASMLNYTPLMRTVSNVAMTPLVNRQIRVYSSGTTQLEVRLYGYFTPCLP
ncbi:MAG: fibronectin type III domain-containing protein [Actinobacteria bacterium]|nr:fibronectin type III domain-containing protein [Actinomycetota bacterium]MCL5446650.1 fibronectin type III domain-containing protein [Actinomycetota bacterium]